MFDRFTSLSVRNQIGLVAVAVGIACIVLMSGWFVFFRVPYDVLFTEMRPADAAAIVADLDRKKIPYRLTDGGTTILVPADVADRTRLAVMAGDVPLHGTVGFELFDRSDIGLTDFSQKINFQRALQGELERTILTLDGVDSARVHLSLGEDRIFRDDQVPPKASVTIRMRKGSVLAANAAQGIQRLIAAAVPNLDAANVVILDETGRIVGPAPAPHGAQAAMTPLDQERRAIEQYYQARARLALNRVDPLGNATVNVSAGPFDGQGAAAGAGPDWSPASRSFPLAVSITSTGPLDAATHDAVRAIVAAAVGYDAAKNDTLEFRVGSSDTGMTLASRPPPVKAVRDLPPSPADSGLPIGVVLVFIGLAGTAVGFLWLLLRPRRLSEARRVALAQKFRELLDGGEHDVVS